MLEESNMNNFDKNCINCYIYYNDRKILLNKHRQKYEKVEEIFPINFTCPNKDCNTFEYETDDEDDNFEPGVNYDNWDIEPNIKIFKKKKIKNEISELQTLFNKFNLNKKENFKKKRKYKQLKITSYDINNLLEKMKI